MGGMGQTQGVNGRVYSNSYPDDDTLLEMAEAARSIKGLADDLGVSRGSLRDYLRRQPELEARVRERAIRPRLTPEQAKANMLASRKKWRDANPDKVREINRRWARNQHPSKRAVWNSYNRERRIGLEVAAADEETREYLNLIQNDPCAYCGGKSEDADHIQPIYLGGKTTWENMTRACRSCNASKGKRTLLAFLLVRR